MILVDILPGGTRQGGQPNQDKPGGIGTMDRRRWGHGMREAHSVLGLDSTMLG